MFFFLDTMRFLGGPLRSSLLSNKKTTEGSKNSFKKVGRSGAWVAPLFSALPFANTFILKCATDVTSGPEPICHKAVPKKKKNVTLEVLPREITKWRHSKHNERKNSESQPRRRYFVFLLRAGHLSWAPSGRQTEKRLHGRHSRVFALSYSRLFAL